MANKQEHIYRDGIKALLTQYYSNGMMMRVQKNPNVSGGFVTGASTSTPGCVGPVVGTANKAQMEYLEEQLQVIERATIRLKFLQTPVAKIHKAVDAAFEG